MTEELKFITENIKYKDFPELIGSELELKLDDINTINQKIKDFIKEKLHIDTSINASMGQIAKLGIIDLSLELDSNVDLHFPATNGLETLKDNNLINNVNDNLDYEEIILDQIKEHKFYIKLFLSVKGIERQNWYRENKQAFLDYTKNGVYQPNNEYLISVFQVDDICITNCKFIWFEKHLYI